MRPGKILRQAIDSLFKRPATLNYPKEKTSMHEGFRGKLKHTSTKCIGCKMCMRDCPAQAITIRQIGEKKFEAEIDFSRCIFCAQCTDTCPRKAVEITSEFELAELDKDKLKIVFYRKEDVQENDKKIS
jgi:formate hydrogenlyase subunit 6/NADH:ubiquinone oxidoreductase subunit I